MDWRRGAGLSLLIVAIAIPTAVFGLPLAARLFVQAVVLLMNACLWVALSISKGASVWSLVTTVSRATGAALVTPMASGIMIALAAVSVAALYLLQRLLGSEEESPE
jgi:hypothetical protein